MLMTFRLATSSTQPTKLTKQIVTYPKTFPNTQHVLIQEKTDTYRFLNYCFSSVHTMKVELLIQSVFEYKFIH